MQKAAGMQRMGKCDVTHPAGCWKDNLALYKEWNMREVSARSRWLVRAQGQRFSRSSHCA